MRRTTAHIILRHARAEERSPAYAALAPESLTKVRGGVRVRSAEWEAMFGDGRLRTLAHAVAARIENPMTTFSHTTAAAVHHLPLYRTPTDRVHVIVPGRHTRKDSKDVVRHHVPLPLEDVTFIDGLRVTTLERTMYDVIRTVSLETAVVCFDAALRRVAWDDSSLAYDVAVAAGFRDRVVHRIARNAGSRGIRRARFVADFADGRAQLPGESVSRLWMWQLGIPDPELQMRVELGGGAFALLDFAWPARGRWGEFDGAVKYSDPEMLRGRAVDEVIAQQAHRERAIRKQTGWQVARWGFAHMSSIDAFAAHLTETGLY